MKITLDARGKKLGRIASEAATLLMGKGDASYERRRAGETEVTIVNAARLDLSARKRAGKRYTRYSGYPGGLREESLAAAISKHGYQEPLRRAVYGMLPANRLRKNRMQRLSIRD
ncbi:MAG: uL13 family ribosomal protein [Parcubacteria group bacterium]|nr:uL13 family ribosomal protein [Parcubacteria group bacterium]